MTCKLHIDFETRSACDLKKHGSHLYAKDASTDALCIAYALDDAPVDALTTPLNFNAFPDTIKNAIQNPTCEIWAHNAAFEKSLWENRLVKYGWPRIAADRWRCSRALCGRWGLPQSLDAAAKFLKLDVQKDKVGYALMMKMCRPAKGSNGIFACILREDLHRLVEYCKRDVEVERQIVAMLPRMEPEELAIWQWTETLNDVGIFIDMPLVKNITQVLDVLAAKDLDNFRKITGNMLESPKQTQALRDWIEQETGVTIANLRAETVACALKTDIPELAKQVLTARQQGSKSSLAKFDAILDRVDRSDNMLRGHTRYAGAHTLRWSGQGAQLQNLPAKTDLTEVDLAQAIAAFNTGDAEYCETVITDVRAAASLATRTVLRARPGKVFVSADFSAIEARGLLWLADAPQLELIAEGQDLYVEMAQRIYKRPIDRQRDKLEYMLGKQAVLGLGYSMGATRFQQTCAVYNIPIDAMFADRVVRDYRAWIRSVPELWRAAESAFINAIQHPGIDYDINSHVHVYYPSEHMDALHCVLPSRNMVYWYPRLHRKSHNYQTIQYSKQGIPTETYGGKIVENMVSAICRDILRDAALRIQKDLPNYRPVLTIHDELVFEVDEKEADLDALIKLMCEPPLWAATMPISAKGWIGNTFRK